MTAEEIGGAGAMTVIMRDALKPNLMQTLENTPVLVHAGPFGNIAHGNSSVVADLHRHPRRRLPGHRGRVRRRHGRGAVLQHQVPGVGPRAGRGRRRRHRAGAEGALRPAQGRGRASRCRDELLEENPDEVHVGGANLRKQIENIRLHGVSPVVAINAFPDDHPSEHAAIAEIAAEMGARSAVCTHFAEGGRGARELAEAVAEAADEPPADGHGFRFLYPDAASLREKIETIATQRLRRRRRRLRPGRGPPARDLRAQRVRAPAGLHREDAPVALVGRLAEGRADRVAAAGARGARLGRRRVRLPDLRRHAHDAGPGRPPERPPDRHRRGRKCREPLLVCPL